MLILAAPPCLCCAPNAQRLQVLQSEVPRLEGVVSAESQRQRERVACGLERNSPLPELSRLAGFNIHDDDGKKEVLHSGSEATLFCPMAQGLPAMSR
nr:hypothetical protein [uncultured Rhodoferax sp.]